MSSPDDLFLPKQLRTLQVIAIALVLGVTVFLVIVLFLVSTRANGQGMAPLAGLPILSLLAILWLVFAALLASILPAAQQRAALRKIASGSWQLPPGANPDDYSSDAAKLLGVRQTTLIMTLALLESAAFFCCIAYLMDAQTFVLALIITAVLLMLWNFPTEGRVRAYLEHQMDRLAELRQQAGFAEEP